ncbi:MAG: sodium:alanine symporter, partial [Chitinophagaceae bacterium]
TAMRVVLLASVFYGAVKTAASAWALGDMGVGLMAWLNLVAIILLRKPALKALKDYQQQRKQGLDPVFQPERLGIKNATVWEGVGNEAKGEIEVKDKV